MTHQPGPEIEVAPVSIEDKSILRHLMELYLHDASEFNGDDVGPSGLFWLQIPLTIGPTTTGTPS